MTTSTKQGKDTTPEVAGTDAAPEPKGKTTEETVPATDTTSETVQAVEGDAPATEKKPRLSAAERLRKQLDEAIAKEKERAGKRLVSARDELEKAEADLARAQVRVNKARAEVNTLSEQAGGVDPIIDASNRAELAAAEADTES